MKTVRFAFRNETPGTFRFEEVDSLGLVINQKDPALVGHQTCQYPRDHA